jgi:hypothetical protein
MVTKLTPLYPPTSLASSAIMDTPTPAADEQQQEQQKEQEQQEQEEQQEQQQEQDQQQQQEQHGETPSDLPPYPPEEPQYAVDAAATSAAAMPVETAEGMRILRDRQDEQARLFASMQSRIDDLENEVRSLVRAGPTRRTDTAAAASAAAAAATTMPHDGGEDHELPGAETYLAVSSPSGIDDGATAAASDDDIDAIIESRTKRKLWPLKRRYCSSFTHEADLVRVRFHVSDRHGHLPVRIPKVDKNEGYGLGNREGRLICRLCSGKTMNRNTSWMCATCVVPLCVDISNGDPGSSCHARWHGCRDLVELNASLNSSLMVRWMSR